MQFVNVPGGGPLEQLVLGQVPCDLSIDKLRLTWKVESWIADGVIRSLDYLSVDSKAWVGKVTWEYHQQLNLVFEGGASLWIGYGIGNSKNKISIVFNPNKLKDSKIYKYLQELGIEKAKVDELDVAYDIFRPPEQVLVLSNEGRQKNIYRGTIYFGNRHREGYCKVYNKAEEQGIKDIDWTRIEITHRPEGIMLKYLQTYNPNDSRLYTVSVFEQGLWTKQKKNVISLKAIALCLSNNLMSEKELTPHLRRQIKDYMKNNIVNVNFDEVYASQWKSKVYELQKVIGIYIEDAA